MKAEKTTTGKFVIDGVKSKFAEFVIGVGWLDPSGDDHFAKHWIVVVARCDDTYTIVAEKSGALHDICKAAVNFKDQFLVNRVFVDSAIIANAATLEDVDGLTHYKTDGLTERKQTKYVTKTSEWPHFRGHDELRYCAVLCGIPEEYKLGFQSCIDTTIKLFSTQKLEIRKSCPRSWWVMRAGLQDMHRHPIMKAISWPIAIMELERAMGKIKQIETKSRYGNLR